MFLLPLLLYNLVKFYHFLPPHMNQFDEFPSCENSQAAAMNRRQSKKEGVKFFCDLFS